MGKVVVKHQSYAGQEDGWLIVTLAEVVLTHHLDLMLRATLCIL